MQHGGQKARIPIPLLVAVAVVAVVLVAVLPLVANEVGRARSTRRDKYTSRAQTRSIPKSTATPLPTPTPEPTPIDVVPQMTALVESLPAGSVSVAARSLTTGATFSFGTTGGQDTASIVKVDIMETLMLQHQAAGTALSPSDQDEATLMIEESDDSSADDLWVELGGAPAVSAANQTLGVPCTVPGQDDHWGLTTTCAQGQVKVLYQLENPASPLDAQSRSYILSLMQNVTSSQRWGVPAAADPGTTFAVKDGWLNLSGDTDWTINSDGVITYHGQTLLISTLTMNNATMASGVTLDQQLASLAAQAVFGPS